MVVKGIRHFGIVVLDIEESIKFYEKYFGFHIEKDAFESGRYVQKLLALDDASLRTVKMISPASETMIELVHFVEGRVKINKNKINQIGPTHFALTVEKLDKIYENMTSDGIEFLSKPIISPDSYAKVVFCKAPEGTFVELVELLGKR